MNISAKCPFPQLALALLLVPSFGAAAQTVSSAPISVSAATAPTVVPALVAYSGTALNAKGNPASGEASITFLIFKDQTGGEPLFAETQTVTLDPTGHYKVNLERLWPMDCPVISSPLARRAGLRCKPPDNRHSLASCWSASPTP